MSPVGMQDGTANLENRMAVIIKFNIYLTYDSAILSYALRQMKICVHIKTCLPTFTAALFIITQKNPPTDLVTTQLSINEWMNKQIMVYLCCEKPLHAESGKRPHDSQSIMLCKRSQTQDTTYDKIPPILYKIEKRKMTVKADMWSPESEGNNLE